MSGVRAGLAFPGADAATIVEAARLADEWNVDSLWIGDPAHGAANADDTYVMVAAAAAAAATTHVRLGVFLSARSSSPPLRIAEDIGVVDQISAGRLSVAFSLPSDPDGSPPVTRDPEASDDTWLADLDRIARAPRDWALGDGRRMPVTPAPAQPAVPLAVFEPGAQAGTGPGQPRRADRIATPLRTAHSPILLIVSWTDPVKPPDAAALLQWKRRCTEVAADELILLADGAGPDATDLAAIFALAGTVVAPCLRAADHEVAILALDATRWLEDRGDLHHPPS